MASVDLANRSTWVRGDRFAGVLKVGQVVNCGLRTSSGRGVIAAIHGEQRPGTIQRLGGGAVVMGGRATVDVAFFEGHLSRMIPEGIVRGVQWDISDACVSPDAVALALADCAEHDRQQKQQEAEAADRRRADRERIRREFSHLEPLEGSKKSGHALAAANIRRELKAAFPGVKFRVRSSCYSGGDSVDIGWTDGPTSKAVEAVTNKYQDGDFNGMEDIYEYDRDNVWPAVYGGAKYVQCQRAHTIEGLREAWRRDDGGDPADVLVVPATERTPAYWDRWHSPMGDHIAHAWAETDLSRPADA